MLNVDFGKGVIRSENQNAEYHFKPIPQFMQELLAKGGLMQYLDARGGFTD
jgi:3-isopropylmalate dehydratase small subunit